jgi:hypothetical protein
VGSGGGQGYRIHLAADVSFTQQTCLNRRRLCLFAAGSVGFYPRAARYIFYPLYSSPQVPISGRIRQICKNETRRNLQLGVALNSYVLLRLRRIARKSVFRFETTCALPLTAMSVADSICLCAELFQGEFNCANIFPAFLSRPFSVLFHYGVKLGFGEGLDQKMLAWFCKVGFIAIIVAEKNGAFLRLTCT